MQRNRNKNPLWQNYQCSHWYTTCYTYNGRSLVGYTLASQDLLKSVGYFEIQKFSMSLNHSSINCALFVNTPFYFEISHICKLNPIRIPQKHIQNISLAYHLELIKTDYDNSGSILTSFSNILLDCAKILAKFVTKNSKF